MFFVFVGNTKALVKFYFSKLSSKNLILWLFVIMCIFDLVYLWNFSKRLLSLNLRLRGIARQQILLIKRHHLRLSHILLFLSILRVDNNLNQSISNLFFEFLLFGSRSCFHILKNMTRVIFNLLVLDFPFHFVFYSIFFQLAYYIYSLLAFGNKPYFIIFGYNVLSRHVEIAIVKLENWVWIMT